MAQEQSQRTSFFDIIKNIFWILIILQIAPSLIESIAKQYSKYIAPKTEVGVVTIKGILYDSTSYDRQLTTFFKDPDIKAILLKIECPGSAAGTGQALFNEISLLKKAYPKPVITLVENVCASGGYYIASSSDHIIAAGTATVGSIGTYLPSFQLKDFIEQFKVHYTAIKAGTYKTLTDPLTERTPQETALLQGLSDDIYEQFVGDIANSRKLPLNTKQDWADGKIFTARQALKLGLIDEIGSAQNAIAAIKEKALIEGEIEWVHPATPSTLATFFGASSSDDDQSFMNSIATQVCTVIEQRYLNRSALG